MSAEDISGNRRLKHLSLRSHSTSSFVFSDAYRTFGLNMTDLEHLELSATGVRGYNISMLDSLKTLPKLTYLNVDGFQPSGAGEWQSLLPLLPKLKTLVANPYSHNMVLADKAFQEQFPHINL